VYTNIFTDDAAVRATKMGTAHISLTETSHIEDLKLTATTCGQKEIKSLILNFLLTCCQDSWKLEVQSK